MENNQPRENGMFEQFEELTAMTSALEKNFALEDLLNDSFLQAYTEFATLQDFLAACKGDVKTLDDLEKLEDTSFLAKTKFDSVEALLNQAMETYVDSFFQE